MAIFKQQKLLTVSIAAYNVEKYLEKTLESCLVREDLRDKVEVIIVNDGSTDNTLKIAKKYQKKYPGIYRVIDKENGGYGSTINIAIKYAEGKYFKILDGDDWFETAHLEYIIERLDRYTVDAIFTDAKHVLIDGNRIVRDKLISCGKLEEGKNYLCDKKENINWSMHCMMIKTSILKDNNVNLLEHCFYTDGEFVFWMMVFINSYSHISKYLYMHMIGRDEQSVSYKGRIKHRKDYLTVLKKELNNFYAIKFVNDIMRDCCKDHIVNTASGVIRWHLLLPYNKENMNSVKEIDCWLRDNYFEIYDLMNKKPGIYMLRLFKYYSYGLCRINELRKKMI